MISFMISVVPPKIDGARLSRERTRWVAESSGLVLLPVNWAPSA